MSHKHAKSCDELGIESFTAEYQISDSGNNIDVMQLWKYVSELHCVELA